MAHQVTTERLAYRRAITLSNLIFIGTLPLRKPSIQYFFATLTSSLLTAVSMLSAAIVIVHTAAKALSGFQLKLLSCYLKNHSARSALTPQAQVVGPSAEPGCSYNQSHSLLPESSRKHSNGTRHYSGITFMSRERLLRAVAYFFHNSRAIFV